MYLCVYFSLCPGLRHFFGPYVRSVSLSPSVLVSSVTKIWNDRLKVSNNRQVATQLQLKQTYLLAQLVKNPPAMQETPVRFLGWEDLLKKG